MLYLPYVLFSVSDISSVIETDNETGIISDILGAYLDIYGSIIYRLIFSPRIPLLKVLLLVIIEDLIDCRN